MRGRECGGDERIAATVDLPVAIEPVSPIMSIVKIVLSLWWRIERLSTIWKVVGWLHSDVDNQLTSPRRTSGQFGEWRVSNKVLLTALSAQIMILLLPPDCLSFKGYSTMQSAIQHVGTIPQTAHLEAIVYSLHLGRVCGGKTSIRAQQWNGRCG